jgi:glycosyltransferase involved in cell wall biosynthesis
LKGARPKLLFLAWSFPPFQVIAAIRAWNIAKYLTRRGWEVVVVTPQPELRRRLDNSMPSASTEGIRQVLTGHDWRQLAPTHLRCRDTGIGWFLGGVCRRVADRLGIDYGSGWIKPAEEACRSLAPGDINLILASGPPFATFVLAERLSKKLRCPYVLDYRDPWTEPGGGQKPPALVAKWESRVLKHAAAVTTVSPSWATDLRARYDIPSKVHVVTNGYDAEDLSRVEPRAFDHFAIVYAGVFYPPERVITPVLAALQRLKAKNIPREWLFHFFGTPGEHEDHVRNEATRLGVMDRVRLHGRVSRVEALAAVRGANIAVVINSVFDDASAKIKGTVPAKVFELIGLETPILLVAPPDTDLETIANSGVCRRFRGRDVDEIAAFLEQMITGPSLTTDRRKRERYAWEGIASTFDTILRDQLISSS